MLIRRLFRVLKKQPCIFMQVRFLLSHEPLAVPHTWVWIRLRPRNQRIWPRRSSRSAWSISSWSSFSSSSGMSSFCVSCPAPLRNLSLLFGIVAITYARKKPMRTGHLNNHLLWISQGLGLRGWWWCYCEVKASYLSPHQFSKPQEHTPHPLLQV